MSSPRKTWHSRLSPRALNELAAGVDRVIEPSEMKPLTAAQRARERRAKRKAGRPRVGAGAEKLRISMERGLLRKVDQFARRRGLSRSQLIAESLRRTLGAA